MNRRLCSVISRPAEIAHAQLAEREHVGGSPIGAVFLAHRRRRKESGPRRRCPPAARASWAGSRDLHWEPDAPAITVVSRLYTPCASVPGSWISSASSHSAAPRCRSSRSPSTSTHREAPPRGNRSPRRRARSRSTTSVTASLPRRRAQSGTRDAASEIGAAPRSRTSP